MKFSSAMRVCLSTMLVVSGTAFATAATSSATPARSASTAASSHRVAFGMDVLNTRGQTRESAIVAAESKVGRKFAFTRDFLLWDSAFPTSYEKWLSGRGTVPIVSVKAETGRGAVVSWKSIADAQPGWTRYKQMKSWATRMRDFGHPVWFTFNHEPEAKTNLNKGSASDYVKAWRKLHDIFHNVGATNVHFMWNMTSWAFKVPYYDRRYASKWYPGDSYVGAISADAYNWGKCVSSKGTWESLGTVLSGYMAFGKKHPGVGMWLSEWGSVEGSAYHKAQWIAATQAMLKTSAYKQIRGVAYYDELQPGVNCNWPISSSSSATSAMRKMATDWFFSGSV